MDDLTLFIIIGLAAVTHASFQLSISVLTLLSGHALGRKTATRRVTSLAFSYSLGSLFISTLLIALGAFIVQNIQNVHVEAAIWSITSGLAIGTGIAVWLVYFRHKKIGTSLWLPREIAAFLADRAKRTKLAFESFGLGILTPLIEIIFTLAPLVIATLAITLLPHPWQLLGLVLYALIASLPHFIIAIAIGGGHSIARIQKWREDNKRFIQFSAGGLLIVLGTFAYSGIVAPLLVQLGAML